MIGSGVNLVMTVIGFAVSTMFIVFVCTRLVCARIQLTASRRAFPATIRSDLGMLERGIHGLEPVLLSSFPTKKFSDEFFSSGEDSQCTVCLGEYQDKDMLRILPYCGHAFHITCIDIWLQQHSTCPVCRISLRDSPDRKRLLQPLFSPAFRSSRSPDTVAARSYNCLHGSPGFSARRMDSLRMESIQEDPFVPDLEDVGEMISSTVANGGTEKGPPGDDLEARNLVRPSPSQQLD
ncbi:RING-H2 finger protein ATL80-like [Nymphaea colorata]|nr:RING-H2 finger protein ATL80-like [Nymphaea colorata]